MPRITYREPGPGVKDETLDLIRWADAVARDYKSRGLSLTVRQLYYQGVTQLKFPNSERSYKNLISITEKGRMFGMMDWTLLEDRGREAHGTSWMGHVPSSIPTLISRVKNQRVVDMWEGQSRRIEVWVEKQALEQVAQRAAGAYRCAYIACKGYMSLSEMWEAGYNRIAGYVAEGYEPLILHIGDHDPSGIDMSRDIQKRLELFSEHPVELRRLALNMDQIEQLNPPPNPAKTTDSRGTGYIAKFGPVSWELDAVRPEVLIDLVKNEIEGEIDWDIWQERREEEQDLQDEMEAISDRWPEIERYLEENPVAE